MADNLKEVIAKLKEQQQQNSQNTTPIKQLPKPAKVEQVPKEIEQAMDEELEEDEEDETIEEETPQEEIKVATKPKEAVPEQQIDPSEQILMEIEMLQNNGRFRAELLNQLQELNRALVVIAGALVDLNGKGHS